MSTRGKSDSLSARRVCFIFLVALSSAPVWAENSVIDDAYAVGKTRFESDCAICHGVDGKGGGAFSDLLKVEPSDLTVLKQENNGTLPFTDIYNAIDGRNAPLRHALKGMPGWGRRYENNGLSDTVIRGQILELILYLDALQAY